MTIDSGLVERIFLECLFKPEELLPGNLPPEDAIIVTGVVNDFGFHPGRVALHKEQVVNWVNGLPIYQTCEGNAEDEMVLFASACMDQDGFQWTDYHQRVEQLLSLGCAVGVLKLMYPKEIWGMLPGGMPIYLKVKEKNSNQQ